MKKTELNWLTTNKNKLESFFNDQDFIQATIEQIAKDFAKFNLFISKNTSNNLLDIELSVEEQLTIIENRSPEILPQLIYTIDLPETIFKDLLANSNSFKEDLAKTIVIREAMKVYLRRKFSS